MRTTAVACTSTRSRCQQAVVMSCACEQRRWSRDCQDGQDSGKISDEPDDNRPTDNCQAQQFTLCDVVSGSGSLISPCHLAYNELDFPL